MLPILLPAGDSQPCESTHNFMVLHLIITTYSMQEAEADVFRLNRKLAAFTADKHALGEEMRRLTDRLEEKDAEIQRHKKVITKTSIND